MNNFNRGFQEIENKQDFDKSSMILSRVITKFHLGTSQYWGDQNRDMILNSKQTEQKQQKKRLYLVEFKSETIKTRYLQCHTDC